MTALLMELVQYIIKFVAMILFMLAGISVGKKLRKNKNEKLAMEDIKK